MYGHTTWPPPCGTTGAGASASASASASAGAGAVPDDAGRWGR